MQAKTKQFCDELAKAIAEGDEDAARSLSERCLKEGVDPLDAIKLGGARGMEIVGERWQRLEVFLSHVMLSAKAMKAVLAILLPKVAPEKQSEVSRGKIVIGTVFGDIHDIGKSLVSTMLSVAGFECVDLGCDVPFKRFIEKAEEVGAKIIAMSSLLTTSMPYQREVVKYLRDAGMRQKYFIMVGGGPVTPEWAKEIGADGYASFADGAVKVARELASSKQPPPLPQPLVA